MNLTLKSDHNLEKTLLIGWRALDLVAALCQAKFAGFFVIYFLFLLVVLVLSPAICFSQGGARFPGFALWLIILVMLLLTLILLSLAVLAYGSFVASAILPSSTIRERTALRKYVFMGLIVGIIIQFSVDQSLGLFASKLPLDLMVLAASTLFAVPSAMLHLWQGPGYKEIARVPVIDAFLERNWKVVLIPVILGLAYLGWGLFVEMLKGMAAAFH
jgi:hypothetical protein